MSDEKVKELGVSRVYHEYGDAVGDIEDYIKTRCKGMPLVAVVGMIEMIKDQVIRDLD